jgi:type II secretory pathway predicted ATPase ExeA
MVPSPLFSPDRPFVATPRVDRFFPSHAAEQAKQRLMRAIERGEGIGVMIAGHGMGKSLLCRMLAIQAAKQMDVSLLVETRIRSRRELLEQVLIGLGHSVSGRSEGELRLMLIDQLSPSQRDTQGLLIIVDEAEYLPRRVLDELRLLSGVVRDGQPRVRLLLAGTIRLEEHLADPRLEGMAQRISARAYLQPLHRDELVPYVEHQLRVASWSPSCVEPSAIDAVFRATDGIPRMVNQLLDHALLMASDRGRQRVDSMLVQEAWADLQQLPSPQAVQELSFGASTASESSAIEFGPLGGEPASLAAPIAATPIAVQPIAQLHSQSPSLAVRQANATPVAAASAGHDPLTWPANPSLGAAPLASAPLKLSLPPMPNVGDPFGNHFEEEISVAASPMQLRVTTLTTQSINDPPKTLPLNAVAPLIQSLADDEQDGASVTVQESSTLELLQQIHASTVQSQQPMIVVPVCDILTGDDSDIIVIEEDLVEWADDDESLGGNAVLGQPTTFAQLRSG